MHVSAVLWMGLLQLAGAELPPPYLTPSSVVPANLNEAQPLQTGVLVSIYGRHLGPDHACLPDRGIWPEPQELCGTVVTVDGNRAGLLYVQERQINLRLPPRVSGQHAIRFVVTHQGRSSPEIQVPQPEAALARISLSGRAYVHMPIWIAVDLPGRHQRTVRYPIRIYPANLGGHNFEVRRNGASLPKIQANAPAPQMGGGAGSPGNIGGGGLIGLPHEPRTSGRLPLHLIFRFDDPGQYQIRYTGYDQSGVVLVRSDWLTIQIDPYPEHQRLAWLQEQQRTAPTDSVDLLAEYLPSLLAQPDAQALTLLEPHFYNADQLVRQYALYALYLFDDKEIVRWIPDVLKRRGPTPDLAWFLSWRRSLFEPQTDQLRRYVSAHLRSKSALVVAGALQSLRFMKLNDNVKNNPAAMASMDAVVAERAESIANSTSTEVLQPLALYLGTVKTDSSRRLLWRMVEQGTVPEQALICLTWIADPRDLPRLATYVEQYHLEYSLNLAYGAAASRYLKH